MGADIFDSKSAFYNDICFPFTANDTDMTLNDRKKLYKNLTEICSLGCEYHGNNLTINYVICDCDPKVVTEIQNSFVRNSLLTLTSSNIKVVKCYQVALDLKKLSDNIGFFTELALGIVGVFEAIITGFFITTVTAESLSEVLRSDLLTYFPQEKINIVSNP